MFRTDKIQMTSKALLCSSDCFNYWSFPFFCLLLLCIFISRITGRNSVPLPLDNQCRMQTNPTYHIKLNRLSSYFNIRSLQKLWKWDPELYLLWYLYILVGNNHRNAGAPFALFVLFIQVNKEVWSASYVPDRDQDWHCLCHFQIAP